MGEAAISRAVANRALEGGALFFLSEKVWMCGEVEALAARARELGCWNLDLEGGGLREKRRF